MTLIILESPVTTIIRTRCNHLNMQVPFTGQTMFVCSQCFSLLHDDGYQFYQVSLEPVCRLASLLAKGGHGGIVDSVPEVSPSFAGICTGRA